MVACVHGCMSLQSVASGSVCTNDEGNTLRDDLTRSLLACLNGEEEALRGGKRLKEGVPGECAEGLARIAIGCCGFRNGFELQGAGTVPRYVPAIQNGV